MYNDDYPRVQVVSENHTHVFFCFSITESMRVNILNDTRIAHDVIAIYNSGFSILRVAHAGNLAPNNRM